MLLLSSPADAHAAKVRVSARGLSGIQYEYEYGTDPTPPDYSTTKIHYRKK